MDQATALTITGDLYMTTLTICALNGIWVYDWFLTVGDEINYIWGGRKSLAFWIFLINRYIPWVNVIWVDVVMFAGLKNFAQWIVSCRHTVWISLAYTDITTFSTQMTIALRVYAVTGKNKLLCSPLLLLIIAQTTAGLITASFWFRLPDQPLPEAILSLFRLCTHELWKPGSLAYTVLELAFDICAFVILFIRAKRELPPRAAGVKSLWRVILRDGTLYFMVIFTIQFFSLMFVFVTTQSIQILPASVNAIVVPIMAVRLTLSLKKAAAKPVEMPSIRFTTTVPGAENGIELAPVP